MGKYAYLYIFLPPCLPSIHIRQDEKLYKLFGLNDLSAHHVVIEAGSLENFQEMEEDERSRRFADILGPGRLVRNTRTQFRLDF